MDADTVIRQRCTVHVCQDVPEASRSQVKPQAGGTEAQRTRLVGDYWPPYDMGEPHQPYAADEAAEGKGTL
jgi:hypothetical protein